MNITAAIKNLWRNTDLFGKLLFTLFIIIVYRLGTFITVIGVNVTVLKSYMESSAVAGSLLGFIDLFTAGSLSQCTLFGLGIMPSITASIVMQLAGYSIPMIEELTKEGEYGRNIINKYTRFLAFGLSLVYSLGFAFYLESIPGIVFAPGIGFKLIMMLSLSAGSMFVMWLGDQIKVLGIGNGSSMILFAGIVSRFPSYFVRTLHAIQGGSLSGLTGVIILSIFCLLVLCVVFLEKGYRKIAISYARRVTGSKLQGVQTSFLPFKLNTVGIMPVIFASSFLNIPLFLCKILAKYEMFAFLGDVFSPRGFVYNFFMFFLIILFTYVYSSLIFDPQQLADNLKKEGGYIAEVRPGAQTASFFDYILDRLNFSGALYLGILAILPNAIPYFIPAIPFDLGGTSLLIVVGVALDFMTQIRSYLLQHDYDSFLVKKDY